VHRAALRSTPLTHDPTTAVDMPNPSLGQTFSRREDGSSPDAVAQLGDALRAISTRVARRERELNRLFEQIEVERSSLLDAVLTRLFNGFTGVIPFDSIECAFLSEDGATTVSHWARGDAGTPVKPGRVTTLGAGALRGALTTGRPLIVNDLPDDAASITGGDTERRFVADGARSALACPLVADGVPLGFLFFSSRRTGAFTDAHAASFQRAAAQVSIVVQKTRSYGEIVSHNRVLLREARRLQEAATTDALTGVLNRRALDEALAHAWERQERERVGFGVIICDIDHFKQVNDTEGHAAGDQLLADSARCLAGGLRGGDIFGRYGGDEFLAIIDTASEATLRDVAQRLRTVMARDTSGRAPVRASFGAAACHRFTSLADLLAAADRALYAAKARGRNCCVMASETDMYGASPARIDVVADSAALVNGGSR